MESAVQSVRISSGIHWVEIPEQDVRILCGCPADTVKHLMRRGLIQLTERAGVSFETGPNAILLSDVSVQNGEFANLAEFPVLQMFYRQGMIIPGHPNNTGRRPLIMGAADQVNAQREYIFRGNFGLVSEDEMVATGLDTATAREYMRIKKVFAFGTIRPPEELIDFRVVGNQVEEICPGVSVERVAVNTYRISYRGDYVEISLNLERDEQYEPPYILSQHKIKPEYFSVVHTGEGDGWDPNRPCMASIIVFQGRVYLIDAGPSVMHTLNALGISVNQIDGIFHTHAHDDHFAGLTSLVRADHRLAYFATPLVRASVAKKLSALMSFPEERFEDYFDCHDLVQDQWNMIEGLEVKPVFSPHPVETTIMFFRALWDSGYRTYAHFADICAVDQLETLMKGEDESTRSIREEVRRNYLTPVDIKKLDVGGGMIHGKTEDFRQDRSTRIVLSHRSTPFSPEEKEIGADTSFGMQDILIRASDTAEKGEIRDHLRHNFPGVPEYEIAMLANCRARTMSIGSIIYKKESAPDNVYLLLNGLVEIIDAEAQVDNIITPGSMLAELNCLTGTLASRTYRAASFIRVLEIPPAMYVAFLRRSDLEGPIRDYLIRKQFLMGTFLLGDRIAGATLNQIAQEMMEVDIKAGETVFIAESVLMVNRGSIAVRCQGKRIATTGPGEALGASVILKTDSEALEYIAEEDSRLYLLPAGILEQIPIVRWKLLEQSQRLARRCGAIFQD